MRWALLLMCVAACQDRAAPQDDPSKMKPAEQLRDLEICKKYVERLCGCAEQDPSLKDQCELARGQPQAVELHMSLLKGIMISPDGGEVHAELNPKERRMTEESLRKIVAACVAADSALDPKSCPRR
jgi:hypothetical protein